MSEQTATMMIEKSKEQNLPRELSRGLSPYEGLTVRETCFVNEYIKNGGNGTRALMAVRPAMKETVAWTEHHRMLIKPGVREAIRGILAVTCLNKEYIVGKFNQLSREDRQESTQLNATKELGRILGLYSDEQGHGGRSGSINLTFNLPGTAREETIIDVKAEEQ